MPPDLKLVTLDGKPVEAVETPRTARRPSAKKKPSSSLTPAGVDGLVLNGKGSRDKALVAALKDMSDELVLGYLRNLENDWLVFREEHDLRRMRKQP